MSSSLAKHEPSPGTGNETPALSREIERKFAAPNQSAIDSLARIDRIVDFALEPPKTSINYDTYVDTPDFTLLRRGLSLRLRQVQPDEGVAVGAQEPVLVTLKGLADENPSNEGAQPVLNRLELEGPVTGSLATEMTSLQTKVPAKLDWLPADIREYLSHAGLLKRGKLGKRLRPYLCLRQTRTKRIGLGAHAQPRLEMSLDQVGVYAPQSQRAQQGHNGQQNNEQRNNEQRNNEAMHHAPIAEFHEIEFEALTAGDIEEDTWLHQLDRAPVLEGLTDLSDSKLERGLRLWAGLDIEGAPRDAMPVGFRFGATSAAHTALREIWRATLVELLLLEHGVRADRDIEFVHQMRVAIRRARTAARFLGHGFKAKTLQSLIDAMRKLARLLGKVRDFDVALDHLDQHAAEDNTASKKNMKARKARARIRARRQQARLRAYKRLRAWLDGKRHTAFIAELTDFCNTEPCASGLKKKSVAEPAAMQVRHLFPALLMEQFTKVRIYESYLNDAAAALDPPASTASADLISVEALHALRIECKRLRYALEFCRHLLPAEIDKFLVKLRKVQEHLGEINDISIELVRLGKRKTKPERMRYQELTRRMASLLRRFPARFSALVAAKSRQRFFAALATL